MKEPDASILSSYLPMSEQTYAVLLALTKPLHGYAIMQLVKEKSKDKIIIGPSTCYTLLFRLQKDGLIKVVDMEERRKVYKITPLGLKLLESENKRMEELLKISKPILNRIK